MERLGLRKLAGIIKVREWPNWIDHTDETAFLKWRTTLSEKEWDRYTVPIYQDGKEVEYAHNLITNLGIKAILNDIGLAAQAQIFPITQIFSVGNGAITGVLRTDTAVAGDAFATNARHIPNATTVTGMQVDIAVNYLSGDAQGLWTNVGWYGYNWLGSSNATTSAGSGQLNTHALFSYNKVAVAVTVDYIFLLGN